MKKILIISNYKKSIGGISGQVEILLDKFNNNQITCELFNTKTNNFKRLLLPYKLYKKSFGYDTFHIHGCSGLGFFPIIIGVLIGRYTKKKIIVTYHGGDLKKFIASYPKLVKYFLSKADVLTVPSQYLLYIFQENYLDAIYLPNIIREDNVKFKKRNIFYPKIIVTRSFEKIYNISLVIKAFAEIKKKHTGSKLYLIGDGSLKKNLQKEVKDLDVKGVVFVGRVRNSEIGNNLNKADIYINPTTADNMPISLFEAFACGLPVISTNVGGIPNFITDNENGFLIDSGNLKDLIKKIDFIVLNQDKIKPIVSKAYNTFLIYTWNFLKPKYNKLYE